MKQKLHYTILLLILFAPVFSFSQEAKKELEKISAVYKQFKAYSCTVSYRLYETHSSVVPFEKYESSVIRSGDKYLNAIAGTIQFTDGNSFVVVDSSNTTIVVSEKPKGFSSPQQMELDSIVKYFSPELITPPSSTTMGKLLMKPIESFKKFSEMEKLEIYYDQSYIISRWIMYSSLSLDLRNEGKAVTKPRLEVLFGKISTLPTAEQSRLDKKYYYYQKGSALFPSEKYKSFRIIDGRVKVTK